MEAQVAGVARDAATRATADIVVLGFSFVTGIATARALGPSGRGTFSTLSFLAGILGLIATVGLGEAAVVWFRRRGVTLQDAVSGVMPALVLANLVAVSGLLLVSLGALPTGVNVRLAVGTACVVVALSSWLTVLGRALNASGNFALTSSALVAQAAVTAAATLVLVVGLSLSVFGAMLAILMGALSQGAILVGRSRRLKLRLRPRIDRSFIREILPYGLRVLISDTLGLLAGRLDLFLVYVIAGHAPAGQYSVALTISGLIGLGPFALGYVTFQRIAGQSESDGLQLITRNSRIGTVLAVCTGGGLAAVAVPLIPVVYGGAYTAAVVPTLLLLVGSLASSIQSVLSQGIAAQGNPRLAASAAAVTVVCMVTVDAALIPLIGITGAGVGWVAASTAGLAVCMRYYTREFGNAAAVMLLPRATDVREVMTGLQRVVRGALSRPFTKNAGA